MTELSPGVRFIDCRALHCDGGRIVYGHPNDPSPPDYGACPICNGTGVEEIEDAPVTLEDLEDSSDYLKYRGKCKEMSEALVAVGPSLTLVRGHYFCPMWGEQAHWWCKRPDGSIIDPTKDQFPSRGLGEYIEFDGTVECSNCGKRMREDEAEFESRYAFCSYECHGKFVGAF